MILAIFEAFWRRWFGSDHWKYAWMNNRFLKHLVNILVLTSCLFYFETYDGKLYELLKPYINEGSLRFIVSVYISIIIQGLYWARAHGPAFDMSRDKKPSEKIIERYKKEWWNHICEYLCPLEHYYGFGYDWLWMSFRYTFCLFLIVPFMGWSILFMGIIVPFVYGFCWSLFEHKPELENNSILKKIHANAPTELAEYLTGFESGLFL